MPTPRHATAPGQTTRCGHAHYVVAGTQDAGHNLIHPPRVLDHWSPEMPSTATAASTPARRKKGPKKHHGRTHKRKAPDTVWEPDQDELSSDSHQRQVAMEEADAKRYLNRRRPAPAPAPPGPDEVVAVADDSDSDDDDDAVVRTESKEESAEAAQQTSPKKKRKTGPAAEAPAVAEGPGAGAALAPEEAGRRAQPKPAVFGDIVVKAPPKPVAPKTAGEAMDALKKNPMYFANIDPHKDLKLTLQKRKRRDKTVYYTLRVMNTKLNKQHLVFFPPPACVAAFPRMWPMGNLKADYPSDKFAVNEPDKLKFSFALNSSPPAFPGPNNPADGQDPDMMAFFEWLKKVQGVFAEFTWEHRETYGVELFRDCLTMLGDAKRALGTGGARGGAPEDGVEDGVSEEELKSFMLGSRVSSVVKLRNVHPDDIPGGLEAIEKSGRPRPKIPHTEYVTCASRVFFKSYGTDTVVDTHDYGSRLYSMLAQGFGKMGFVYHDIPMTLARDPDRVVPLPQRTLNEGDVVVPLLSLKHSPYNTISKAMTMALDPLRIMWLNSGSGTTFASPAKVHSGVQMPAFAADQTSDYTGPVKEDLDAAVESERERAMIEALEKAEADAIERKAKYGQRA